MVTLSIMAVLAAIAAPSLQQWVARNRMRAVAESLQNALGLASAESEKRGTIVALTLTSTYITNTNAATITPAVTGTNWAVRYLDSAGAVQPITVFNGANIQINSTVVPGQGSQVSFMAGTNVFTTGLSVAPVSLVGKRVYRIADNPETQHLYVYVSQGGAVRLCDPALNGAAADPRRCDLGAGDGLPAGTYP